VDFSLKPSGKKLDESYPSHEEVISLKKKHEEHENHERWLVSYADFITLLFAFFVVMYAVSSVNEGKYRTLSESLVSAFSNHKPVGSPTIVELPFAKRKEVLTKEQSKIKLNVRAYVKIANAIQSTKLPDGVSVTSGKRGLNIRISDDALFASGSASIRPEVKEFLDLISGLVKDLPNYISVEGHSDSVPIRAAAFPSNWELSASRASVLVRYFTDVRGLDPQRFSAISYAGYRPVASNDTAKGRSANRRVEIVILRHTHAPTLPRNPFVNP